MKKSLIALASLAAMGEIASAGWARKSSDGARGHELRAMNAGGLLANIDSATLNANRYMQSFGEADIVTGSIALAANPTAADVIRLMKIPAGNAISTVILANDDLDSNGSPTIVFSMGYAPVDGVSPAAVANYFQAAGDTSLQSPNAGKVYSKFDEITFDKDVYLTLTVGTASATFAAGSIYARALGKARGVK